MFEKQNHIFVNLQKYTEYRLKARGGRRSLRELLKMGTWLLNPERQDKEQIQKETGTESADGGAGNATAIEKKAQQEQTAKENEVHNAVSNGLFGWRGEGGGVEGSRVV